MKTLIRPSLTTLQRQPWDSDTRRSTAWSTAVTPTMISSDAARLARYNHVYNTSAFDFVFGTFAILFTPFVSALLKWCHSDEISKSCGDSFFDIIFSKCLYSICCFGNSLARKQRLDEMFPWGTPYSSKNVSLSKFAHNVLSNLAERQQTDRQTQVNHNLLSFARQR